MNRACVRLVSRGVVMTLVLSMVLSTGVFAQTTSAPKAISKLSSLLEQSEYRFTKAAENVWVIKFEGKSLQDFHVFVTSAEGVVVIGAIVAKKATMKVTPEMMHTLLKLTHSLDRAKIGFDDDGDLFARIEVSERVCDLIELKANVKQLAAVADEVSAAIKQFIGPSQSQ